MVIVLVTMSVGVGVALFAYSKPDGNMSLTVMLYSV